MDIKTFDNQTGPSVFFKAAGHPLAVDPARALIDEIAEAGPVAIFDSAGHLADFAALYDIGRWQVADVFVARVEDLGAVRLGKPVRPISELRESNARILLLAGFDAERTRRQIEPLLPPGMTVVSFDALRLPQAILTNEARYLDPLNFACDFVLFRDQAGWHTRLSTGNYWSGYGARTPRLWLRLFDADGATRADWWHEPPPGLTGIQVDSAEIRRRIGGGEFAGSLFVHAVGAAGHDVIKYALDIYGDGPGQLSCTHDSNPWPADYYAGLPAPAEGERVRLLVQNCHPTPIPANAVKLNRMGNAEQRGYPTEIPAFGTAAIDVGELFPELHWPDQLEIAGGRHFGRPRYEVTRANQRFIAHANVERTDLQPDPKLPDLIGGLLGKGYLLPGAVPPVAEWQSWVLPTAMARSQQTLPFRITLYDPTGRIVTETNLGCLDRGHSRLVDVAELRRDAGIEYGHVELSYDFSQGGEGDGWLHALFRYRHLPSGRFADTSFGSHLYNVPVTYKKEPQSYVGSPPGLTTRLFLRLGLGGVDTLCHLIYPCSAGVWRPHSTTLLTLCSAAGADIAQRNIEIAQSGSLFWRYHQMFDSRERAEAGDGAYVVIRDTTCRLFGFHGLLAPDGGFAFDHMFGF